MDKEILDLINEIKILRNTFMNYNTNPVLLLYFKLLTSNYKNYLFRKIRCLDILNNYHSEFDNKEIKNKLVKVNKIVRDMIRDFTYKYYALHTIVKFPIIRDIGLGVNNVGRLATLLYFNFFSNINTRPSIFYGYIGRKDSSRDIAISDTNLINGKDLDILDEKHLKEFLVQTKFVLKGLINLIDGIITVIKDNFDTQVSIISI